VGDRVRRGGGGAGGVLENGPGPPVLFRADIDALPVEEATDLPYRSEVPGVMHACGHDLHITAGLGAAAVLAETTDAWSGTYVALFQPGEETAQGAQAMVEDGLADAIPRPDVALGQHVLAAPGRALLLLGVRGIHPGPAAPAEPQPALRPRAAAHPPHRHRGRRGGGPGLPRKGTVSPMAASHNVAETATPQGYRGNDKLLLGMVLAVTAFWLFAGTAGTVAPAIMADINAGGTEYVDVNAMNFAVSVTALFSGLFIVLMGGIADRVGQVRISLVGVVINIVGSALLVFAAGGLALPMLITGRALQGFSAACIMPATMALVKAYWDGPGRQRAVSMWSIGSWGGSGLAAVFG